jgi:hypothetical protein
MAFWYDALGWLTLSQNAEQRRNNLFSYTSFDPLGRTVEVGIGRTPLDYPVSTNLTSRAAADAYQPLAEAATLFKKFGKIKKSRSWNGFFHCNPKKKGIVNPSDDLFLFVKP